MFIDVDHEKHQQPKDLANIDPDMMNADRLGMESIAGRAIMRGCCSYAWGNTALLSEDLPGE